MALIFECACNKGFTHNVDDAYDRTHVCRKIGASNLRLTQHIL